MLSAALLLAAGAGALGAASTPRAGLGTLTADQLAGQRIVCAFAGRTVPTDLARRVSRGHLAGVILFSGNIGGRAQIRRLTTSLQGVQRPVGLQQPLLVMTDQEGGQVRRLPAPPSVSAATMGARGAAFARRQGSRTGRAMRALGINVDLAPVLDVARARGFIADQGRGFGRTPAAVAANGVGFARGLQARGVAATAKHFPGLGSTAANTDLRPARIGLPVAKLRAVDERPYAGFVAAGGKLVMVSSAVYPALDPWLLAFQSRRVVTDELRGRLGFSGVTITDSLEARAVTGTAGIDQTALRAATAGMDLLLYTSPSCADGERARLALAGALASGALPRVEFEASVTRVLALRASL
ncbi:MAG: glycoside hydrolase family 3 N-terminal domain-containing protein [Solirubrobacterales bacterium]